MKHMNPLRKIFMSLQVIICLLIPHLQADSYEAESLSYVLYGGQYTAISLSSASGGMYVRHQAWGDGNAIEFSISNLTPGNYNVDMHMYQHAYAGIYQTSINGVDVGSPIDYYGSDFADYGYSAVPVGVSGVMTIRFTCVGLNSSALSRRVLPDNFTLSLQAATVELECEDLIYSYYGNWVSDTLNINASNGHYLRLDAAGMGNWIEFETPWLDEGAYNLSMVALEHGYNGIYQLQVNGIDVGPEIDYFNGDNSFVDYDFGQVNISPAGNAQVRFTCKGKAPSALAYRFAPDQLRLSWTGSIPSATDYFAECESLSYSVSSGTVTPINQTIASGGQYLYYQSGGVGAWVEFTIPNVSAGTYTLDIATIFDAYNGIYQLAINGVPFSTPVDYYKVDDDSRTVQYRNVVIGTTGPVTLRFTCTGQNAAAYSTNLIADAISLSAGEVSGPVIILKLDDLTTYTTRWQETIDFLIAEDVTASFGIIGYGLDTNNQAFFNWVKDLYANTSFEFWNHGYMNRTVSDPLGEYEVASVEDQLNSLLLTQNLAVEKLGITLKAFGPHWSYTNAQTIAALDQVPGIESVFYYTVEEPEPRNRFIFERFFDLEVPLFSPNSAYVIEQFTNQGGSAHPYLCFQGHANQWDAARLNEFKQAVLFLKAQGCAFMTPTQYIHTTIVNQ